MLFFRSWLTAIALILLVFVLAGAATLALASEGIEGITLSYFPVLPFEAPPDTETELIPVLSNHSVQHEGNVGYTRAIIAIHDLTRDPDEIMSNLMSLAGGENKKTLIMAPQFLIDGDIARYAENLPDDGRHFASWTVTSWSRGDNSLSGPERKPISSYNIVDLLLLYLSDESIFPDLKQIVILGYGEGGRFVDGFAAVSRAASVLEKQHINVSFIIANAPSYLYLTPVRYMEGKQGLQLPRDNQCANYNAWPYGLDDMPPYAKHTGINAIKINYASQQITYLVGANLRHNDPIPDGTCAAAKQGKNRAERADLYHAYLHNIYGDDITESQHFIAVPKTGYEIKGVLESQCGQAALFSSALCDN